MARNRDNAPVGYSCEKIDQVISFIKEIHWHLSDDDEKDLSIECKQIVELMEEIRKENDSLRTWLIEHEQIKGDLQKEVKNLKFDLSNMIEEIKDLKAEIETLEEKLSDVDNFE